MVDINQFIRNPDSNDPAKLDRQQEMPPLDWRRISQRAAENNVILKPEHREVIAFLREYYLHNGWPQSVAELSRDLESAFGEQGGRHYLFELFPDGPLAQGTRIAELPQPPHLEQPSQGTVH